MTEFEMLANLLKLVSDQAADTQVQLEALRLTLEAQDAEFHSKYESRLGALRIVRGLLAARNDEDIQRQIDAEYKRLLTDSAKGKPQ